MAGGPAHMIMKERGGKLGLHRLEKDKRGSGPNYSFPLLKGWL